MVAPDAKTRARLEEQLREASINRRRLVQGAAVTGLAAASSWGGATALRTAAQDASPEAAGGGALDDDQVFYNFVFRNEPATFDFNAN
ncbi:MAG: hypothetical protein H0V24_16880, partial [Chloroflexia bacterium]|nr:hypothetical protein [Chloroflexia bacterium]